MLMLRVAVLLLFLCLFLFVHSQTRPRRFVWSYVDGERVVKGKGGKPFSAMFEVENWPGQRWGAAMLQFDVFGRKFIMVFGYFFG